jgi:hypothetical protein
MSNGTDIPGDANYYNRFKEIDNEDSAANIVSPLTTKSRQAWLRRWEIMVYEAAGGTKPVMLTSSDFGPSALRATFDTFQCTFPKWWECTIEIYNLDGKTTDMLLSKDMKVIVNAGYQNAQFGEIYHGRIIQPLWERENAVDFKTTLHCVVALDNEGSCSFINKGLGRQIAQRDAVRRIAAHTTYPDGTAAPLNIKSLSDEIDNDTMLPRGQTYFGDPSRYLKQIAASNNVKIWYEEDGFSMGGFGESDPTLNPVTTPSQFDTTQAIVYSPQTGIVGTPVGTPDGVTLRVLLDNRVKPRNPMQAIVIDNSQIRVAKWNIGQNPTILDRDGTYYVRSVHHTGDTRGEAWYTDILGTTNLKQALPGA